MGYVNSVMGTVSELRLPADREHILVAKRAAGAFGSLAGFDMDAIDDLTIAVAQACENAVRCLEHSGSIAGQVRIVFKMSDTGLEVTVRSTVNREAELRARAEQAGFRREGGELVAATDLALRLMGLFVDDSTYRVDDRTGSLRVRLTKYKAS
ncbi:MAG: ATP-binding protein [Candidatus Dormiibacterota bacterium]